jgi:hypothetical protein
MGEFGAFFLGLLSCSNFGGCFLLGRSAGLALLSTTLHGARYCSCGRTFSSVARYGPNGGTARGTASSAFDTAAARCVGVLGSGLLFGLFLFRRLTRGSGSFRIDPRLLSGGRVAIAFVL